MGTLVFICCRYEPFGLVDEDSYDGYLTCKHTDTFIGKNLSTVVPTKSDSDLMFCLQSNQGPRMDRSLVY